MRFGTIKNAVAKEARRRLYYNTNVGDLLFNKESKLFICNRSNGVSESIYPSTESFWARSNRQKKIKVTGNLKYVCH